MKCINFDELVQLLKSRKQATILQEIKHEYGVYRNVIIEISPYVISIEYIDIAGYHVPLKFLIKKDDSEEIVSLDSISQLNNIVSAA